MIRHTLRETVHGVEGVTRKRRRHDPLVMGLMQRPVYLRMVQSPMDPVDEQIREADKEGKLQEVVQSKRCVGGGVV